MTRARRPATGCSRPPRYAPTFPIISAIQVGPLTNALVVESRARGPLGALVCSSIPTSWDDRRPESTCTRSTVRACGVQAEQRHELRDPDRLRPATYLWSIAPGLTPQQLKTAMTEMPSLSTRAKCPACRPRGWTPAATLSLDAPGPPARRLAGAAGVAHRRRRRFEDEDLAAFARRCPDADSDGSTWSPHDLNGDGLPAGRAPRAST
jgi:hypothetical protein